MSLVSAGRARAPVVLAVDVGTTSVRAELYDARGRLIRDTSAQAECRVLTTPDGGAEIDPDELLHVMAATIDETVRRAASLAVPIAAVATSTFWHTVLGLDGDDRPTTPLFLLADSRSRGAMAALRERLNERAVHARTGCPLHWSYLPAKLLWLSSERSAAFRRTRRWVSFGEYAHLRLFGRAACSISMASGTGLFDQHAKRWDPEVIAALPIAEEQLSPLVEVDQPFLGLRPPFATRWPALRDTPWFPAVGDGACSNVGSGCVTRQRMALMVGTSGALRVAWRGERATVPWGAWCYRVDGRRFVIGGALTNGGNLFAWMRDTLRLPSLARSEQELARMEPDSHGLTVLPFLAGERSPGYATDATGAVLGLTLATRPIEILRASLEAVALRFALVYQILRREVPEATQIVATGGALLRSPAWTQMMADALGQIVVASAEREGSSRGAALLALEALGAVPSLEEVPAALGRAFEPDPARHERYRAAQERHRRYYRELVAGHDGDPATQDEQDG